MYSGGNNSDSNKDLQHPYFKYSSPGSISHDRYESSASSDYAEGCSAISAQPASSLYAMHQQHQVYVPHLHQLQVEQQQRFLHNPQEQWPQYVSQSSAASSYTSSNMPHIAASLASQEEEHLVTSAYTQSLHLQELNVMEQFFYNEQLMRRMQASGVDSKSVYDSSSSHGYGSPAAAAGARYEEACTPRPRWTPTQEQIQILESIFNSGTTTPSRDMIVDIAAQLRKYGNIAEANVFYWFQNRKARAKRKLQPPPASP